MLATTEPRLESDSRRALREVVDVVERGLDGFEQARFDDRQRLGVRRNRDVAGVGAESSVGGQAYGTRHARPASDDEHRAGAVLRVARALGRYEPQNLLRHEPVLREVGVDADLPDLDVAHMETT